MIRSLLYGNATLIDLVLIVVVFVFSVTIHEVSHGYAAYKLGDPTAKNYGRLTLNPAKHLDPIGTICILLFGFGWAKPVPVNSRYFNHPKRDDTIVSLAGPVSNLFLAFLSILILDKVCYNLALHGHMPDNVLNACTQLLLSMIQINISLAIFNLLPIPPLDGSHLLTTWAPYKWRNAIYTIERFGFIGVYLVLMLISRLGIFYFLYSSVLKLLLWFVDILPFSSGICDVLRSLI